MPKKVFVSYSHQQREWVSTRLVPCLKAGGADVLIDLERFKAGTTLVGQMDALQSQADVDVLILSPEYVTSSYCLHEMRLAVNRDPAFGHGIVIPVERVPCDLPAEITIHGPLHVDLSNDKDPASWKLLLDQCDADLGATAPEWLRVRDEIVNRLRDGESVNWVTKGRVGWRALLADIQQNHVPELAKVDLDWGSTVDRGGLVKEILLACGSSAPAVWRSRSEDLEILQHTLEQKTLPYRLALLHFDNLVDRDYGLDLFRSLRSLVMDRRKLVLLIGSRVPLAELLASISRKGHSALYDPLSSITFKLVELQGSPN